MAKEDLIEVEGVIKESLPDAKFRIELDNGQAITAHLSGKMRMHRIHLLTGDEVKVEISPYDLKNGRVVYRF